MTRNWESIDKLKFARTEKEINIQPKETIIKQILKLDPYKAFWWNETHKL